MKKVNFNLNGLKDALTKEQMKNISGGYGNCVSREDYIVDHSTSTCIVYCTWDCSDGVHYGGCNVYAVC